MYKFKLTHWQWLLIVVFFIFFVNLDVLYINLMETRNMLTAREMVNLNHWVLTTIDNLPRYEKPPLPTWITAFFGALFGFKSFIVMRLPAAFMSLLTVGMVYKFSSLIKLCKHQSFINALIMGTTFYLIFSGRTNQWDVYTHAFMLVSIYFGWKFLTQDQNLYKNAVLSALFFGFSFMSKGPISLYTLWLPFLVSFGFVYNFKNFKIRWKPLLLFLVIGFTIGLWWFIYVRLADPAAFIEVMKVESSRWGNYNTRPFYYYWNFFIQTGVWTIPAFIGLLYPYLKTRVSNKKAYKFALWWTLFSVILLSLVPEKKPRYLLPALIPLAINTGFYIEFLFRKFKTLPLKESWVVYFNHSLIALVCLAFPIGAYFLVDLEGVFWIWYVLSSILLVIFGLATLRFLQKKNYPKVFYLTIAIICTIMTFAYRLTDGFISNPKENSFSKLHLMAQQDNFQVYEYGDFTPQVIWEYGEPIPQIDKENPVLPQEDLFGILVYEDETTFIDRLKETGYKIIKEERYDVNYVPPTKRSYKNRLVRKFYLMKKE